jgi:hypothetical protein
MYDPGSWRSRVLSKKQQWFISACVGILIATGCVCLSCLAIEWLGAIFLPGALLAALIFPQGIHGDAPYVYLVLAFVLTAA